MNGKKMNISKNLEDLIFHSEFDEAIDLLRDYLVFCDVRSESYRIYFFKLIELLNRVGRFSSSRFLLDDMLFVDNSFEYLKSVRNTAAGIRDVDWFLAKMLKYKTVSNDYINPLFNYGILKRDLGQKSEGLDILKKRMRAVFKNNLKAQEQINSNAESWSLKAREALFDLKEILDSEDIEFFLKGGLLLGCVREDRILEHDYDIDLGVDERYSKSHLERVIRETGLFFFRYLENEKAIYLTHRNGTLVDIFLHYEHDGLYKNNGMYLVWANSKFKLVEVDFLGAKFKVPDDCERYLTETYGEWRVPKDNYNTYIDNPNSIVIDQTDMAIYFVNNIVRCYLEGKSKLAIRLASKYKEITGDCETYNEILKAFKSE